MNLDTPLSEASKLLKIRAGLLEKLGIQTIWDLLFHIPFRYEDYSLLSKIARLQPGEKVTIQGEVLEIKNEYTRRFFKLQKAKVKDDSGILQVTWFNQPFIPKVIHVGDRVSLSGTIGEFSHQPTMENPEYEVMNTAQGETTLHTGRLVPIYPETKGISSKWLRRQIFSLLTQAAPQLSDPLPEAMREKHALLSLNEALWSIHFPKTLSDAKKAKLRLSFDELFFLHITSLQKKHEWKENLKGTPLEIEKNRIHLDKLISSLPFLLTPSQQEVLEDIFKDLASEKPMNRLLEGEVGSGKTVVSAIAMYAAFLNGYQSAIMAPTEILAQQHYNTISNILSPFGVRVDLRTSSHKGKALSKKGKEKNQLHPSRFALNADIVVGTHALLSEKLTINKLAYVVIDEQQRFGVKQRGLLRQKAKHPHLLTMTATPIPRTVALTLYGELDLSFLSDMPHGRKQVKTWVVPEEKRDNAYTWISEQITKTKSQAFIICPFIETSENLKTVKAATKEYEHLKKDVFPHLKLRLLHGRLKAKEKETVLKEFKDGAFDVLVATPVVEVGIDIPNATIIIIEAAERFGLSQLHQLRGRVGRGLKQSFCLLFIDSPNDYSIKRLKAMETLYNGPQLAELDYQLRGPGEIYGTSQHGTKELKIASFSDTELIIKTKNEAESVFKTISEFPKLQERIAKTVTESVSPD